MPKCSTAFNDKDKHYPFLVAARMAEEKIRVMRDDFWINSEKARKLEKAAEVISKWVPQDVDDQSGNTIELLLSDGSNSARPREKGRTISAILAKKTDSGNRTLGQEDSALWLVENPQMVAGRT
ncbi:hypothetical protein R1sor_015602 [Riccia sorocarpa]|uniref:Uncharacterized protein n=1 Tax=Riccia sorocarpa TaxID=122646 RepID=A0ABD3HD16_9MARC